MPRANALFLAGMVGTLVGAVFSFGGPRFAWHNSTLLVDYAGARSLAALGACGGATLAAWAAPRVAARWALIAAATVGGAFGLHRTVYRLEADPLALAQRGVLGTDRVPWKDVSHVERGPAVLVVWGNGDAQVRIGTGDLPAEERSILERTVTRRVREAGRATDRPTATP